MVAKTGTAEKTAAGGSPAKSSRPRPVKIRYFAVLREERGLSEETIETRAITLRDLYRELKERHGFRLDEEQLRVAVKDQFVDFDSGLEEYGDLADVVFIPPVAGG